MRWLPFLILFVFLACRSSSNDGDKLRNAIKGKWLIQFPDHKLSNRRQRELYGKMQDSIVGLTGLKLVEFFDDGRFQQIDSLGQRGRWGITPDTIIFVEKAGKGFENFSTTFAGYDKEKDVLKLTELVPAEEEKIKLVWHLKRLKDTDADALFSEGKNAWRKKPAQPESEKEIKDRLAAMLHYYSDYYELVSQESSYFVGSRVPIPFQFYQHAMGLRPLDSSHAFTRFFYDYAQAQLAYSYLSRLMKKLKDDYPRRNDFVREYAAFMKSMAYEFAKQ